MIIIVIKFTKMQLQQINTYLTPPYSHYDAQQKQLNPVARVVRTHNIYVSKIFDNRGQKWLKNTRVSRPQKCLFFIDIR